MPVLKCTPIDAADTRWERLSRGPKPHIVRASDENDAYALLSEFHGADGGPFDDIVQRPIPLRANRTWHERLSSSTVQRQAPVMPWFFFHIRDGDVLIEDQEGVEVADLDGARQEGIAGARDILAARLKAGKVLNGQQSRSAIVPDSCLPRSRSGMSSHFPER